MQQKCILEEIYGQTVYRAIEENEVRHMAAVKVALVEQTEKEEGEKEESEDEESKEEESEEEESEEDGTPLLKV